MVRGGIVLLIAAVALGVYAGREMAVSSGTQSEPLAVDLAKLEAGETPASNYVRVGEHWALYPISVYGYRKGKYDTNKQPTSTTSITHCYYPLISKSHSFAAVIPKVIQGNFDGPAPDFSTFRVLVKTERFGTLGSIPKNPALRNSVDGLFINRISSLDKEEAKLLKQEFPRLDLDKVLILEEDRKPTSMAAGMGMMFGAIALAGGGVGLFVVNQRRKKAAAYDNLPTLG